jgi:prepilin-type N-terminal cleavage/methylation domain-containing protein
MLISKKNNKGFSLVELIVVIAIMAILAAVAVVSFSVYIQKAKEANDLEYESNVKYFAQLAATEHQFVLDDVELEDIVDGPEDIKLVIVVDPVTGEEIYTPGSQESKTITRMIEFVQE